MIIIPYPYYRKAKIMKNKIMKDIKNYIDGNDTSISIDEVTKHPKRYSLLSKLVKSQRDETFNNKGDIKEQKPDFDYLLGIASDKAQDIDDNETIMQLLPDLERCAQILISYILSPKYLLDTELVYSPPVSLFPQTVTTNLTNVVKDYITNKYKLDDKLYGILYNILFTKGSYPIAIIPEASLDELINDVNEPTTSNESLVDNVVTTINNKLNNYGKNSYGFFNNSNRSKTYSGISKESYNVNGLEVSLGDTDKQVNYKGNRNSNVENFSSIYLNNKLDIELPKELLVNHTKSENNKNTYTLNLENTNALLDITDDFTVLLKGDLTKRLSTESIRQKIGISRERNYTDKEIIDKLFTSIDEIQKRSRTNEETVLVKLKTNNQTYRENLNEPLILELPPECIIPITKPGIPEEHIGYLILLDEDYLPLNKTKPINYYRELSNSFRYRNSGSMAHSLIQQGKMMFEGFNLNWNEAKQIEMLARIYGNAIIKEVINRLKEGELGKNLDIGEATELYRIMFYRALQGHNTKMVFVPKEILQYFAFDYDNRGIGISILDNMKTLLSLRIQFLLAQVRAGIINSIPETVVGVTIDEKDPDPKKTLQVIKALIMQTRMIGSLQLGNTDARSIEDNIVQSNIRININSEHPGIPNIAQEVNRETADIPTPDQDTADMLTKYTIMGLGLPPDLVDNSLQVEFAAQVVQNNLITNNTVYRRQQRLNPQITEFVKKVCICSPKIRKDLESIITDNIEEILETINEASGNKIKYKDLSKESLQSVVKYLVDTFIGKLEVTLPIPDTEDHEVKKEKLEAYKSRVEEIINSLLTEEALPPELVTQTDEEGNEINISELINKYGNVIKHDMIRTWMVENNYFADIADYFTVNDENIQTFEKNKAIREMLIKAIKGTMEFFNEGKNIAKSTVAVAKVNEIQGTGSGGGFSSSDSSSSSDSDSGSDEGGSDDFGDDFDFSEDFSSEEPGESESNESGESESGGDEGFSPNEGTDGAPD